MYRDGLGRPGLGAGEARIFDFALASAAGRVDAAIAAYAVLDPAREVQQWVSRPSGPSGSGAKQWHLQNDDESLGRHRLVTVERLVEAELSLRLSASARRNAALEVFGVELPSKIHLHFERPRDSEGRFYL